VQATNKKRSKREGDGRMVSQGRRTVLKVGVKTTEKKGARGVRVLRKK